jgi:hypothetical protein
MFVLVELKLRKRQRSSPEPTDIEQVETVWVTMEYAQNAIDRWCTACNSRMSRITYILHAFLIGSEDLHMCLKVRFNKL